LPLREKSLIARIRHQARGSPAVLAGIGDDCALLRVPPRHELLVTTDFTLEDVHFRRHWHPPGVVGRRCLTRGLSDIAAMGGEPLAIFLSLALPKRLPQTWVDRFLQGLLALANEFKVPLAGGDTAQSSTGIQADIIVVGSVPKGTAVLRSGARTGDQIYVTGALGGSAAALVRLRAGKGKVRPTEYRQHFHPTPRLEVAQWLRRRSLASAMIDLSDGLSTDLAHLCEESGVGAVIEAGLIPRARLGRPPADVSIDLALHGGEDYELLFTSPRKIPTTLAGVSVTRIGQVTRTREMTLIPQGGRRRRLAVQGWEHFR
jgi:thiamine-monophosphate kinase